MIECQLDDSFAPFPTAVFFAVKVFHACCLLAAFANSLRIVHGIDFGSNPRIDGIARILPLTVSNPFSGENPSRRIVKLRICR